MQIRHARLTPVAFADPPLLNCMGVHEPFALRSVLELVCEDGVVGLGESYGDAAFLEQARKGPARLDRPRRLRPARGSADRSRAALGGVVVTDSHGLTGGFSARQDAGQRLLAVRGGRARRAGPRPRPFPSSTCSAAGRASASSSRPTCSTSTARTSAGPPTGGARPLTPDALVAAGPHHDRRFGFRSIKLKGGVFEPEPEADGDRGARRRVPRPSAAPRPQRRVAAETSIDVAHRLDGVLEYLEDPTPGIDGMAEVARQAPMPLATNMCVVSFADVAPAFRAGAVGVVLSDHHFWGGLRDTLALGHALRAFGVGLSMHSNSHLGISLAAMVHVAAATPHSPTPATPTGRGRPPTSSAGRAGVPRRHRRRAHRAGPGRRLDRDALARAHERYARCGQTNATTSPTCAASSPTSTPNTGRW